MVEAVAKAAGVPPAEVRRATMLAGGLDEVAHAALAEGSAGLAGLRARALPPRAADARADGGRRHRGARARRGRGGRMEARRGAPPGAPAGRRGARLHAQPRRRDRARPGGRRGGARSPAGIRRARRRGDRTPRGRPPAPVPGHDEPVRLDARARPVERARRSRRSSSTASTSTVETFSTCPSPSGSRYSTSAYRRGSARRGARPM